MDSPDVDDDEKSRKPHISDDLFITYIFCKLPLPCMFRCTAVCKAWRSLVRRTKDLYGGSSLMTHYALGFVSTTPPRFKIIIPHGFHHNNTSPAVDPQVHPDWSFHGASSGFLLYCSVQENTTGHSTVQYYVCNPLLLRSVPLPVLHCCLSSDPSLLFSMLIFNPARSRHYKVIAFFGTKPTRDKEERIFDRVCVFFSKQIQLGWRSLEVCTLITQPNEVISMDVIGALTVCVKGNAYLLGFRVGENPARLFRRVILGFHVQQEHMELINSPPLINHNMENSLMHELGKAEDCLQYIYYDVGNISIWRMDEDDRSWALRHQIHLNGSIPCAGRDPVMFFGSCALAFHRDEEFLYFIYGAYLCCWRSKHPYIELCRNSDGRYVSAHTGSLISFLCCTIDP